MENLEDIGKTLLILGCIVALIGVLLMFGDKVPVLRSIGKLPGDVVVRREGFQFYFPFVTSLILSGVLSLVAWLLRR